MWLKVKMKSNVPVTGNWLINLLEDPLLRDFQRIKYINWIIKRKEIVVLKLKID